MQTTRKSGELSHYDLEYTMRKREEQGLEKKLFEEFDKCVSLTE